MPQEMEIHLTLPGNPRVFPFRLCRKQATFGDVVVGQYWMPLDTLYGQRNRPAANQDSIVEFWWNYCAGSGTITEDAIAESYLLAKILPHARSNGSRKVFLDSIPIVPEQRRGKMQEWVSELDLLVSQSRHEEYDGDEFRDTTADLIGPPRYGDDVGEKYLQMTEDLLGEGRTAMQEGGLEGVDMVLHRWQRLMNSIGRHRGNSLEKEVLSILSYECRAALHRCYSAVWVALFYALGNWHDMSEESYIFHQLWHLDRCRELDWTDQANFHLFHGHIFGLHPACGPLLLTRTGGELVGEWLSEGTLCSYHRLLHALAVAVAYYGQQHNITALLRKVDSTIDTVGDMVALEEEEVERRSGRRRKHRSDDD